MQIILECILLAHHRVPHLQWIFYLQLKFTSR